ncbi:MAG TPA: hypothetical protein VFT80_08700, partial [Actinomycetota bacterium]|nr:hypothetical protein [Actinomycetota bacterium]
PSLARWWRAFCAGEVVSQASLNAMTTLHDDYGLGLYDVAEWYEQAVGYLESRLPAGCCPGGTLRTPASDARTDA